MIEKLFQQFNELNILIIGDVMMDSYLWGTVDRISPEAPVPIVSVNKKENRLGGAANVALNVQSLGAKPIICSVIGNDKDGLELIEVFKRESLSIEGILPVDGRVTTVKTRVIGHNQQILRIDAETDTYVSSEITGLLISKIEQLLTSNTIHAIIFEDYDKGVITQQLVQHIVALANQKQIITIVDPKKRNFLTYQDVTLFKPNLKELREGLKLEIDPEKDQQLEDAVDQLKKQLNAKKVMVTLSELGIYMSAEYADKRIPANIRKIADVSGAGDTVIATATLCLASGLDDFKSAAIANLAGGLVCEHVGVVPINKDQLLDEASKLI